MAHKPGVRVVALADDARVRAQHTARVLEQVLEGTGARASLIERAAAALGISTRQVYALLGRYKGARVASTLVRKTSARGHRLDPKVEGIIEATLRQRWLTQESGKLAAVVAEIRARAEEAGCHPPAYNSIAKRIPIVFSSLEIAKHRGGEAAVRRLIPRPGYITAPRPLAVVQADHTPSDINFIQVVDGGHRYIGRAYLTVATDVYSRAVLGFCLTLERPSRLSVALCLAHALCRKDDWLEARGMAANDWPMFGRPKVLLVDMGAEFRSALFKEACEDFGINVRLRNRGNVHTGGIIERLLGILNGILGGLYGRTGNSVADRGDYPALARACLTFEELERCVALAILHHNNRCPAKTLMVPQTTWLEAIDHAPRHNDDPTRVLLHFLPNERRALTPQGVSINAIDYYGDVLGPLVPDRDRLGKLDFRYDPRDVSRVYLHHPQTKEFVPVGRRDGSVEKITLWEHALGRRDRRSRSGTTEKDKVRFQRQIWAISDSAHARNIAAKKIEVRNKVRAQHAAAAPKPYQAMEPETPAAPPSPRPSKKRLPMEEW